jgi:BirA family biotin operon repressor/biotin-[acetyl-CoA-carboxylase] ligase
VNAEHELVHLLLSTSEPLAVDALARQLHRDAGWVRHELDRLRRVGAQLDVHPQRGVRLVRSGLPMWVDYLETRHRRRVIVYAQTRSTQDVARQVAGGGEAVVLADAQTAGRGRLGRPWVAPPGTAVLMTATGLAAPTDAVDRHTFLASVAVARAVESLLQRPVAIKWPNDIYVDGRKLAGILVEAALQQTLLGVGVNVHLTADRVPANLADRVTSFAMLGRDVDRLRVIDALLVELATAARADEAELLAAWRQRSTMLHHHVTLLSEGKPVEGEVIDLDPREGLILRTTDGQLRHLRAATTTTA